MTTFYELSTSFKLIYKLLFSAWGFRQSFNVETGKNFVKFIAIVRQRGEEEE